MIKDAERRLIKDLGRLQKEEAEGIVAMPIQNNMMLWSATIEGAEGTIWDGGVFTLKIQFTHQYPNQAPSIKFMSKMFHPNIYQDGRICLDMLSKQWSPTYDILGVLTAIRALLLQPNLNSPANAEASEMFKEQKNQYERRVKEVVDLSLEEMDYDKVIVENAKLEEQERKKEEQRLKREEDERKRRGEERQREREAASQAFRLQRQRWQEKLRRDREESGNNVDNSDLPNAFPGMYPFQARNTRTNRWVYPPLNNHRVGQSISMAPVQGSIRIARKSASRRMNTIIDVDEQQEVEEPNEEDEQYGSDDSSVVDQNSDNQEVEEPESAPEDQGEPAEESSEEQENRDESGEEEDNREHNGDKEKEQEKVEVHEMIRPEVIRQEVAISDVIRPEVASSDVIRPEVRVEEYGGEQVHILQDGSDQEEQIQVINRPLIQNPNSVVDLDLDQDYDEEELELQRVLLMSSESMRAETHLNTSHDSQQDD